MNRWIDADERITIQLYDDEHEEWREEDMTIAELLDQYTDEGCPSTKQEWIPCSERLPKEHEWIGTKTFGTTISDEVYVTFESPKGERFTKHLSFQNGKVPGFKQREIDVVYKGSVPIAWMPLPEPWKGAAE